MTFDHQMHGLNVMTRLNWEARIAAAADRPWTSDPEVVARVDELAEYLLFIGEAPLAFEVTPRPGFVEALAARAPADRQGRSCAQMDLTKRLLKYSCSYLLYLGGVCRRCPRRASRGLSRLFGILDGNAPAAVSDHLLPRDRRAIEEILGTLRRT